MSKKHNDIDHISPELFRAYREGNLSADEMYAVEKYLLENPFEAEALEGLESIDPATLEGHLNDLNTRINSELSDTATATKSVFWTTTMKIAASVLVILTATFLYFQLNDPDTPIQTKNLTELSKEQQESPEEETSSSARLDQDNTAKSADETNLEKVLDKNKTNADQKADNSSSEIITKPALANTQTAGLNAEFDEVVEEVKPDLAVKAKTEIPKSLESANLNLQTNDLITTDSITLRAASSELKDLLRGRAESLTIKKEQENKQLGFLSAANQKDSMARLKAEEEKIQTLTELRVRNAKTQESSIRQNLVALPNLADSLGRSITGVVTDDTGAPLRGVSVQLKGTGTGILTDENGAYTLKAPDGKGNILFRYLGYTTQEIPVGNQSLLNVEMQTDIIYDSEVMVSEFSPGKKDPEEIENRNLPARPVYGQKAFNAHIKENLIYPEAARANNIRGRVLVEFTVKENGDLADFKILKGLGYGCDEEAIRLIKTGPRWQARTKGSDESVPVESKVKVRIRFKP